MRDPERLRDTLVREAVTLLESGTTEPSLRELARRAGVSAMAPYRHFADKAALLRAVAEYGFERLREDLEAADKAAEPADALIAQGLAYVAFAHGQPALFRLMFRDHCGPDALGEPAYDVLARRAGSAVPRHPEAASLACWAIVHGLATLALDGRIPYDPDATSAVLTLFLDGLRANDATLDG